MKKLSFEEWIKTPTGEACMSDKNPVVNKHTQPGHGCYSPT